MQRYALTLSALLAASLTACGGHAASPRSGQTVAGVAPAASEGITALAVVPSGQIQVARGLGAAFQIAVDGHHRTHDAPLDLTREVSFVVEDESVCTISGDGLIAPVGTGVTTVRVRWQGPEGQSLETATEVAVTAPLANPPELVELEIHPAYRTLDQVDVLNGVRQRQQLLVLATDADGRRHDLTRDVAIEVLDGNGEPALINAHVSNNGLLTGGVNGEIFTVVRIPRRGLLAASHFVLGTGQAAPADTGRFYSGYPLAGSTNPLDQAIFANLEPLRLEPAPLADDGEFLRRLYGDTLDRAPTAAELVAFEADDNPAKRAEEIDRVLASAEFSARWAGIVGEWLEMPRRARILGTEGQRFDLTAPANTLSIVVDGGAAQTITFVEADFPNQGLASALAGEVVTKINQSLQGARAVREGAFVSLVSEPGYGRSLEVLNGAGAVELGLANQTSTVIDTWARDALDANTSLGEMVAELVRGEVPAFEAKNPSAADKVDVLMQATTAMTAKCAKCHDHPLTGINDPLRWTQQERYPIDAFFATTPEEARAYDARTGQRFGDPLQPFFVLAPNATVGVTLSSPLAQRRAALARILSESAAFQRGLGHRVFAEVATPLLDPNQFLQRDPSTRWSCPTCSRRWRTPSPRAGARCGGSCAWSSTRPTTSSRAWTAAATCNRATPTCSGARSVCATPRWSTPPSTRSPAAR
jgi:hypothetical protein